MSEKLVGVVHAWVEHVKITGYTGVVNEHVPPGTVGDLEVFEVGRDGTVLVANFHPGGRGNGYGQVVCPLWEYVKEELHGDVRDVC